MAVSPNENCAPSVAVKQQQGAISTIESLRKECDALRQELQLLQADREEEQQGILRARAALEEKEYQVWPCFGNAVTALFWRLEGGL